MGTRRHAPNSWDQERSGRTGTGAGGLTASSRRSVVTRRAPIRGSAKHVLEFTSVNRGNVQQHVIGSGDGVGAQHIRQAVQSSCELGVTGLGIFGKGDQDEGFDARSDLLMINDGADSLAVIAELLDRCRVAAGESPRRRASSMFGKSPRTCNSAMITQSK